MCATIKKKSESARHACFLAIITFLSLTPPLFPQENSDAELSLKDLLNLDVITVSKSAEKQSNAPGIVSVITADELDRFGGTTLKDILERVPGLLAYSGNLVDRSIIAARGDMVRSNSGHVLLLINGRPVRDITSGINSEIYETFPVNIIKRIEVIKGPGSVLYGSDAFSAVINIITQKAEKNNLVLTGLAGNGGAYGASGGVTFRSGDVGVVAAGRYFNKSEWNSPYAFHDRLTGLITTTNINIPDKGAGTYVGANYKGFTLMATYNEWTSQYFTSGMTGIEKWTKSFNNAGYDFKISDKWNMSVILAYTYTKVNASLIAKSFSHNMLAEWTNFITLTDKAKLIVGGLYNNSKSLQISLQLSSPGMVQLDDKLFGYGLYAQMDYWLLESLKLIGGMQANKTENLKMDAISRIGVIWSPVSCFGVKALYSEAFKAPYITELFFNDPSLRGDPNLKPEKVGTVDISASYQGDQIQAGVNYFSSKQTNIIHMDFSKSFPGKYSNLGKVDFWGLEFEGKYYINRSFYINGSVLYQENKDENGNKNVTPVANLGTKAGISYVGNKGITVGFFDIYQGDLDKRFIDDLNRYQGSYNLLHLHSAFDVNRLFAMKFKPALSLIINVDNMLDNKHYAYALVDASPTKTVVPGNPGRTIYAGIDVSF